MKKLLPLLFTACLWISFSLSGNARNSEKDKPGHSFKPCPVNASAGKRANVKTTHIHKTHKHKHRPKPSEQVARNKPQKQQKTKPAKEHKAKPEKAPKPAREPKVKKIKSGPKPNSMGHSKGHKGKAKMTSRAVF